MRSSPNNSTSIHMTSSHGPRRRFASTGKAVIMFRHFAAMMLALCLSGTSAFAEPPRFSSVVPGVPLTFPRDFGAHPDFRNEWWYVTGWLQMPDGKQLGFQVTFFRVATGHDRANPSRFAPQDIVMSTCFPRFCHARVGVMLPLLLNS